MRQPNGRDPMQSVQHAKTCADAANDRPGRWTRGAAATPSSPPTTWTCPLTPQQTSMCTGWRTGTTAPAHATGPSTTRCGRCG